MAALLLALDIWLYSNATGHLNCVCVHFALFIIVKAFDILKKKRLALIFAAVLQQAHSTNCVSHTDHVVSDA